MHNSLPHTHSFRTGFTAVELIISLGVVTLLTSLLILYNRTGQDQLALFAERAKLLGVISEAKALTIQTFAETSPPCGYGVRIPPPANNNVYHLFINKANDADCAAIKSGGGSLFLPARDSIKATHIFPSGVVFNGGPKTVLFIPPDPTVRLNPPSGGNMEIKLKTKDGTAEAKITINEFGQITI